MSSPSATRSKHADYILEAERAAGRGEREQAQFWLAMATELRLGSPAVFLTSLEREAIAADLETLSRGCATEPIRSLLLERAACIRKCGAQP